MSRRSAVVVLRAVWRLARVLVQALRGVAIVTWRFPRLDAAGREAAIGRWSLGVLEALGIGLRCQGKPAARGTLLAANHVSWLDIVAIHALVPEARFVSKAGVRDWPLIGRLADAGETLYLARERKRDALRLVGLIGDALAGGQSVAVFPEGTTADGRTLLPFHANLLQAAITTGAPVQPVALRFADAFDPESRAVEFVGETTLLQSLWRVVAAEALVVHVALLTARSSVGADRRVLADALRADIVAALAGQTGAPMR